MRFIQILPIPLAAAMLLFSCGGCGKIESASVKDGYATDYAMSATEYTIFLGKQLTAAENVVFTRFLMAQDVIDGKYETEKELENAEEGLSKISSILDEVTVTMPATGYETDRQNTIDRLADAKAVLEDYVEALEENDKPGMKSEASSMKEICLTLSGEANVYYQ